MRNPFSWESPIENKVLQWSDQTVSLLLVAIALVAVLIAIRGNFAMKAAFLVYLAMP